MASKKVILKIGTCNYHGWQWDISLVNKPPLHHFHHILYCLVVILNYQPPCNMMLWQ
jgi:hypothetical protein